MAYTMIVERDPESGWLVGSVVELPGCYSQAPDLPTLEQSIREAIEAYLAVADDEATETEYMGTWKIEAVA